ncbi:helix-turn-helix transcriptional regulator [Microbacterium sp.]|uniref:helix-turn-helix transcriptional regulator n=1 Tax=Microbacterium sp. TaxID=51671 RepID=UPI0039E53EC3
MSDAVARLTPLSVMVLALLREDDMHPYEMIRLMRERHDDRIVPLTNGTVYHTVARLQRCGLIAEVGTDREGNRPERTTYALTDAGRTSLPDWVRRELARLDHPTEFRVALAAAHDLDRAEVIALLTARAEALDASRELHRAGHAKALAKGVPEQYIIEVERQALLLDADLTWVRGMIERLADPDFSWGPSPCGPTDRYLAQREAART